MSEYKKQLEDYKYSLYKQLLEEIHYVYRGFILHKHFILEVKIRGFNESIIKELESQRYIGHMFIHKNGKYSKMYYLKYKSYKNLNNSERSRSTKRPTTTQICRSLLIGEMLISSRIGINNSIDKRKIDKKFIIPDTYLTSYHRGIDSAQIEISIFCFVSRKEDVWTHLFTHTPLEFPKIKFDKDITYNFYVISDSQVVYYNNLFDKLGFLRKIDDEYGGYNINIINLQISKYFGGEVIL